MFTSKLTRSLHVMLVIMAAGAMVSLSGCSLFHKKAQAQETPVVQPGTPVETPAAPESAAPQRPLIGSTVEFDEATGVRDIRFDYDKATIRPDQTAILDTNLQYFKANPNVKIMIEGHTDERGTVEYNFSLGQRRAAAVQDYLVKNGIAADRLATVSKGEENPVAAGNNEAAWAQNRRAHFMRIVTE